MKKALSLLLAGVLCVGLLAGCGGQNSESQSSSTSSTNSTTSSASSTDSSANSTDSSTSTTASSETSNKKIDTLRIAFVPSREPEEIITATEALSAGTADVGLIPGGTYVLYDDGCDVLLTATRDGLSIDSDNAKDWNDNAPTEPTTEQVTSYRALMIAGPSEKGKELAAKVNAGEALTWEDVSSANWSVANSSSPAGYIYPSLWLQENFDKNITDLPHAVQSDSYGSAFARLASGQVDILCTYADARRDYEDEWTTEYGMTNSIWDDTAVVGVTPAIYNDTISVSKTSPIMDDDFKQALGQAFINIGNTEEGKEVIAIYSHNGYQWAKSEDYDSERAAQEMIQSLNSAG